MFYFENLCPVYFYFSLLCHPFLLITLIYVYKIKIDFTIYYSIIKLFIKYNGLVYHEQIKMKRLIFNIKSNNK